MKLIPLPAFTDNYIWMLHDTHQALVVDPGDAQPVLAALQHLSVQLEAILVTHHHLDHTGAVDALRQATGAKVLARRANPCPSPRPGSCPTTWRWPTTLSRPRACAPDSNPPCPPPSGWSVRSTHFLRTREAAVMQAAQGFDASASDEVSIFAALRRWKNEYP